MRAGLILLMGVLLAAGMAGGGRAQTSACSKSDFEAVVDEAAANLRTLNQKNTPVFQAKLRQLKEKRGWSHDQFLKEAAPFVRDDAITQYDRSSEKLLDRITSGGQAQAGNAAPDCALLTELRASMKVLVETQQSKWAYMFEKIDKELRK